MAAGVDSNRIDFRSTPWHHHRTETAHSSPASLPLNAGRANLIG
jgi:hypothetical protein